MGKEKQKLVRCSRCCQEWPRDPALEVVCPTCNVGIGVKCKRPSGHNVWGDQPHEARDRLAMERGFMEKCKGNLVRQAKFREDMAQTDIPARNSERPQLEEQETLTQWAEDRKKLKNQVNKDSKV